MTPTELRRSITGCPGEEHLVWLLTAMLPDAPEPDAEAAAEHCAFAPDVDGEAMLAQVLSRSVLAAGLDAVSAWSLGHGGLVVVTFRAVDCRDYDLVASVDDRTGRLVAVSMIRSLGTIQVAESPIETLSDVERDDIRSLFEQSYGDPDPRHIERQLRTMTDVVRAWDGGRLVGFLLSRNAELDLPGLGATRVGASGSACVDPELRRFGLADGMNGVASVAHAVTLTVPPLIAFHFATPVTIHIALRALSDLRWPGPDVHAMEAAYASPTATQRAVGRFLADDAGATDYDDEHWVLLGAGEPSGRTALAEGLDPAYERLFRHVDRERGDTLLGPFWTADPPAAWFV